MSYLSVNHKRGRGLRSAATAAAAISLLAGTALLAGAAAPAASASVTTPCGSAGAYSAAGTAGGTCTYAGAGTEDTFTVPFGVTDLDVTAIGAPGGSGAASNNPAPGGNGAIVTNPALAVQPGATLYVDVGAPGADATSGPYLCTAAAPGGLRDGGAGGAGCINEFGGGGGGGSSDLSKEPLIGLDKVTPTGNAQDPRLIVAGGGGGGGGRAALYPGGNGGNAGGLGTGPGPGGCGNGYYGNGDAGGTGGIGGTQGGAGAICGGNDGSSGTATAGGAGGPDTPIFDGGAGGGGGGGWFGGGGGSSGVITNSGGGGGGGGSSYLGLEVSGDGASSTIATATSQAPSVTVTWSQITLVFSGRISADINGSIVAGGLHITWSDGVVVSVTGTLVIQAANDDIYLVKVDILWFPPGRYIGQISVSGPGVHITALLAISSLAVSGGLVSGVGRGFTGSSPYTLSFTL
jgi:hypothetical protein